MKNYFSLRLLSILILIVEVLNIRTGFARSGNAIANGNWNSSSTWIFNGTNSIPNCGDTITIPSGMTVTVSSSENLSGCSSAIFITVGGTLQFTNGNKLTLPCNSMLRILAGGLVKKSTPGGGNSTNFSICGAVEWSAADGPLSGYASFGAALPVTLLYFDAKERSGQIDLSWATASEINNDYFIVEKSTNGDLFEPVVTIKGAGNSSVVNNYNCTDENAVSGISYYRLNQVDYDGKNNYSDIIPIQIKNISKPEIISVSKNDDTSVHVSFRGLSNEKYSLQILDQGGKEIESISFISDPNINSKEINFTSLKTGIYYVTLSNKSQSLSTRTLLIK